MGKGIRYHTGRLRKVAAWLAVSLCLFAQSPLEEALRLTREKRYEEADRALAGVTEPSRADQQIAFHRLKAAIASGLNDYANSVREMRSALALAPQNSNLLLATAMAEFQAGQLEDALEHVRHSGNNALAESLVGDIEERRGNYLEAARAYQAAVKLEPGQQTYRIALGVELIRHQTFRPAIELLEESAALFPQSAKIRELLGIGQYAAGYTEDATKSLEEAIDKDTTLVSAYKCLAQIVLQSSAAPTERTDNLLCAWDQTVCSALKVRIARQAGDSKLQEEAITQLKLVPGDNVTARCELGRAYEWSGQLNEARTQTEECVRLDPTPQNHYRLGLLYRKLGLTDLARREMDLRARTQKAMSDQTALGLKALEQFEPSPR